MKPSQKNKIRSIVITIILGLIFGILSVTVVSDKAMDLVGKLIIAVIGFIAPFTTLLFSIFHEGISILRTKFETEVSKHSDTLKEEMTKQLSLKGEELKQIKNKISDLEKKKKAGENKIRSLDLKIQIQYLFSFLFISLIFICVHYYLVDKLSAQYCIDWAYYNFAISCLCFISFSIGILRLWKLICILIDVKTEIEAKNKKKEEECKSIAQKEHFEIVSILTKIVNKGDLPANSR